MRILSAVQSRDPKIPYSTYAYIRWRNHVTMGNQKIIKLDLPLAAEPDGSKEEQPEEEEALW